MHACMHACMHTYIHTYTCTNRMPSLRIPTPLPSRFPVLRPAPHGGAPLRLGAWALQVMGQFVADFLGPKKTPIFWYIQALGIYQRANLKSVGLRSTPWASSTPLTWNPRFPSMYRIPRGARTSNPTQTR